jgi:hypothetical protein
MSGRDETRGSRTSLVLSIVILGVFALALLGLLLAGVAGH